MDSTKANTALVDQNSRSELLHRVIRLRQDVSITAQTYRQERWFLLSLNDRQLLIDANAFYLLSNPSHTPLIELLEEGVDLSDVQPLLTLLINNEMLEGIRPTTSSEAKRPFNPISIKLRLFNPELLLTWLNKKCSWAIRPITLFVLAVVWLWGIQQVGQYYGDLAEHFSSRFLDPTNLFWIWLLFPLVKAVHELAHGLLAHHWGARVQDVGVMFLVFMPVPYVDASESSKFQHKHQRMLVAAAGIIAELTLSCLALLTWINVEPGLVRDLAFNICIIGGVSTLLFNGNPLLRFDGYYVFADLIEIPNLGPRSNRFWSSFFRQRFCGFAKQPETSSSGLKFWLAGYGLLAWPYRLFVGFSIAYFLLGEFFEMGVLLAIWLIVYQFARPLVSSIQRLVVEAKTHGLVKRTLIALMGFCVAVLTLVFLVPTPNTTSIDAVLLPAEEQIVRSESDGFVSQIALSKAVDAGDVLLEQRNLQLLNDRLELQARISEMEVLVGSSFSSDRSELSAFQEQLKLLKKQLALAETKTAGLTLTASRSSTFQVNPDIVAGQYLRQGQIVGYLSHNTQREIVGSLSQNVVDDIQSDTRRIRIQSTENPWRTIVGDDFSVTPNATLRLPSATLGTLYGGAIPVDASVDTGVSLLRPRFDVRIRLSDNSFNSGQHFLVQFLHTPEPVGIRIFYWLESKIRARIQQNTY